YEAWVAGVDPATGEPRGRLRRDAHAVRFLEVTVNGPKSWSLAAELHPDIAAAYEAAQDRAASQIIAWLGQHATVRVGGRGAQVAIPVERLEAAVIRHYTSRAGDPHRHLHLQINARVFAAGQWRGIDTIAVRDALAAINGIGHAAMLCDPQFRQALAAHGYAPLPSGEIAQLAPYIGAFSKRATQIDANIAGYEADWRATHPGEEPGPRLWRAWDTRAWASGRPDKITPQPGADVHGRWLAELAALGYRDPTWPIQLALPLAGAIDRDAAAAEVLARLGAARSAWNAADVRGEVEQLLARSGLVAEAAVRGELAEDLTARARDLCLHLVEGAPPEHVRALTSRRVLEVEDDLVARLAARGAQPISRRDLISARVIIGEDLDEGQWAAVAAITSAAPLVVIEGAAGAGKTRMLASGRVETETSGHRLLVVTPTLKAAQAVTREVGAKAGSAAWLAYQHGWRWDPNGSWKCLTVGEMDLSTGVVYHGPSGDAVLSAGDVLVVDEAGMLDQDTALALLTIADEHAARVALVGDRHQLPAVGRGGVLEHAHRWTDPAARVQLDRVHRFTRSEVDPHGVRRTVPDRVYAELSLRMRVGDHADEIFDALLERGQVAVYASDQDRNAALAETVGRERAAGRSVAAVVDTRDLAAELNAAIRDWLIANGEVDDSTTTIASGGQQIGVGDTVATRRNAHDLGVANRDTWTVTHVHRDGSLTLRRADTDAMGDAQNRVGDTPVTLPADYVREHVECAYATTVHGAQGDTTATAHLLLGEHSSAASAYVAMTRGRHTNTVHIVAKDLDDAREQWTAAFARARADLGPAAARQTALRDAAPYAALRPWSEVVADLRQAWDLQAETEHALRRRQSTLERAITAAPLVAAEHAAWDTCENRQRDLDAARARLAAAEQTAARMSRQIEQELRTAWDTQRAEAQTDARRIKKGTGLLGYGRGEVAAATARLDQWAAGWEPIVGNLHEHWSGGLVGFAGHHPDNDHISVAVKDYA
ncbi:MAG: MobF family relaxase, partial [Allobranchiibius sp.]